jgi:hypothetical protein
VVPKEIERNDISHGNFFISVCHGVLTGTAHGPFTLNDPTYKVCLDCGGS